jgi:hypothetical protein
MTIDASFAATLRPEPEHAWKWGLYSATRDRWVEAIYPSRQEAEQALTALAGRRANG